MGLDCCWPVHGWDRLSGWLPVRLNSDYSMQVAVQVQQPDKKTHGNVLNKGASVFMEFGASFSGTQKHSTLPTNLLFELGDAIHSPACHQSRSLEKNWYVILREQIKEGEFLGSFGNLKFQKVSFHLRLCSCSRIVLVVILSAPWIVLSSTEKEVMYCYCTIDNAGKKYRGDQDVIVCFILSCFVRRGHHFWKVKEKSIKVLELYCDRG